MRTVTKSNPEWDFFSFMSKQRKYANVLPVLAQNKRIYTWHVNNSFYPSFARKKSNRSCSIRNYAKVFRHSSAFALVAVADPGPLMLGVLDRWTTTVKVLQTCIAQINYHKEMCPIEAKDSISRYTTPLSIWHSGFRDFFILFCLN